jgi:hypothetical protein
MADASVKYRIDKFVSSTSDLPVSNTPYQRR